MPQWPAQAFRSFARRAFCACLLLVVHSSVVAASAALPPGREAALLQKIQRDGVARVIVRLDPSSETVLLNSPAAFAGSAPLHAGRKAAVSRLQKRLQGQFPATRFLKQFRHQPAFVVEADRNLLQRLANHPLVVDIQEDRLSRPVLDQSVPRIGADVVHVDGFQGNGWSVAVLDSGVDSSHEFLSGRVIAEACFSTTYAPLSSRSLCPDGSDAQIGSGAGVNCTGTEGCDHGTHVAGIAAGQTAGLVGVAPQADLIAVQVFSRLANWQICGSPECILTFDSDVVLALEHIYSLRDTLDVAAVNMSIGGAIYTSVASCDADKALLKSAIDDLRAAGIATVISSGNEGVTNGIASPACISTAVSVGATTPSDTVASFSNSASWLSLLAPGTGISSSVPGGNYSSWSGTSMAAPHVAGAFAVLRSKAPASSVDDILNSLVATGLSVTDSRNSVVTPRIQVDSAAALLDPGPAQVTVDNQDPNTIAVGDWQVSSAPDPWQGQSLYSNAGSFRWSPNLAEAGNYEVFAWWTYHRNRSTAVPYTVVHAGGSSTSEHNQRDPAQAGKWVSLGVYPFAGDGSGHVEVSAVNGQACADAVRFVATAAVPNQPPSVAIDAPATGASFDQGEPVTLQGSAADPEDGDLSSLIQWQSSIDGALGSGASVTQATLAAGTHTITASVTDSGDATESASIQLIINTPGPGAEIIVDNQDPGTSWTGRWRSSSGADPWQGQSVYNDADNSFRWPLTIPALNEYLVYAWWTYHPNRGSNVPYTINFGNGSDTVSVNQADPSLAGKWVLLGSYTFTEGGGRYVEVSSVNGQASADAIRLVAGTPPDNFPPGVSISAPAPDSEFSEGELIDFTASALDTEDGDISAVIQWQSDLDGDLGDGAALPISDLSIGTHQITATATDSGGASGDDTITVSVIAADALEIIVDNRDANTSFSGEWVVSSGANPWQADSVYNNGGASFRWSPQLTEAGVYRVYAWWTYHRNRSSNVPYLISHAGADDTVPVDQSDPALAARWVLLGSFNFSGDGSGYVEISSENGQASADAIRWVKQ